MKFVFVSRLTDTCILIFTYKEMYRTHWFIVLLPVCTVSLTVLFPVIISVPKLHACTRV